MKDKISTKFPGLDFPNRKSENLYIMDYTNQTGNVRGIEWSDTAPADIDAFTIHNLPLLNITFCAFKENTVKVAGERGERPHCEGILFPTHDSTKTWILFLELKYPKKRNNLGSSLKEAREQLILTLALFREQGIIEAKRLVYLIFCAPKYSNKTPFESWSMRPEELKEIRKKKYAIMRGVNCMKVISDEKLKV